jgi:hypothetical protein
MSSNLLDSIINNSRDSRTSKTKDVSELEKVSREG